MDWVFVDAMQHIATIELALGSVPTHQSYIGKAVPFSCRTEGDRFYQSGNLPIFEGGKKIRDSKLEEVWKRVE